MSKIESDTWLEDSTHIAMDDPVPADSESGLYGGDYEIPHSMEQDVQRALLSLPDVQFSSLRVHRLPNGICLTGLAVAPEGAKALFEKVAAEAAQVEQVLNYLVVQTRPALKKAR